MYFLTVFCSTLRRGVSTHVYWASKMVAIYEKHNPAKLPGVDEALDKYEGRWAGMLEVPYRGPCGNA